MLRFLPGLILVQLLTVLLVWLNLPQLGASSDALSDETLGNADNWRVWLRLLVPCVLLAVLTGFWFASVARALNADAMSRLQDKHAREREKLQIDVERDKVRMVKQTHKEIQRNQRRTQGKANFKVALAFGGMAIAGAIMIITELITLGMMTLTTAGGALGGYVARGRGARQSPPLAGGRPVPVPPGSASDDATGSAAADGNTKPALLEQSPKVINAEYETLPSERDDGKSAG